MTSRDPMSLHRDLDLIAGSGAVAGLEDVELLERFLTRSDDSAEAAFEAIVSRHGPMVRGICRSLLRNSGDADDAFQATFLVLIRKAGSVRVKDSLRPWLYGVAWRVALKLQAVARRRRTRELSRDLAQATERVEPDSSDLRPILLEEVARLPERYRLPIVLCHLEGMTHEQVAKNLRCPVGTISSRLSRARELLRKRLERRGLRISTVTIAMVVAAREAGAMPPKLLRATVRASTGGVFSSTVHHLAEGVIVSMVVNQMKLAGLALAAGTLVLGAATGRFPAVRAQQVPSAQVKVANDKPIESRPALLKEAIDPPPIFVDEAKPAFAPVVEPQSNSSSKRELPRLSSVEAPVLTSIMIDGDLKDWPAAMPRYAINHLHTLEPYYGFNGLERADFSTSADLSAAFSVGYDPNEQLIYLAVIVRDDKPIVGNTEFWDTDAVEVFLDGSNARASLKSFPDGENGQTVDAANLPLLQYIAIPGVGRVYGVKKSAGQERAADNPILMFGDVHRTKTRMVYRRVGDVTTYEWALQAFDHYPDKPTQLIPFKKIGFDIAVVDKDKPAVSDGPSTEPEEDRSAWISWSPLWKGPAFLHADRLGEIVLGRIP